MKKFIISIIFIVTVCTVAFTETYQKPASNEVVLVFSVNMRPALNKAFFEQYLSIPMGAFSSPMGASSPKISSKGSPVRHAPSDTISVFLEGSTEVAEFDDTGVVSVRAKVGRGVNKLYFDYAVYNLFGGNVLRFTLPMSLEISIPKGAKYLYVGNFEYRTKKGVEVEFEYPGRSDNMEQITPIIKGRYGDAAELLRAPVTNIKK